MDLNNLKTEDQKFFLNCEISSIGLNNLHKYREKEVDLYFIDKLNYKLDQMEKKIQKKWNLESRLYLSDANDMYAERSNLISDAYYYAKTLQDMNNKEFLSKLKSIIYNHAKTELKNYSKEYQLNQKIQNSIMKDISNQVEYIVDDLSKKYLNNKTRDIVANFQNKWNKAIENKDYDTANYFAGQIRRMYNAGIYKDDALRSENMRTIYIDDILDNKRKTGQNIELTDMEKEAIDKYMERTSIKIFLKELKNYLN